MADNLVAIPEGATIGDPQQQGQPQGQSQGQSQGGTVAIPQGASLDAPPPKSMLEKAGGVASDVLQGVGAGAIETGVGLGNLGHKIIHKVLPEGAAETLSPTSGVQAMNQAAAPLTKVEGAAQHVGYGGESLLEFIMGDEALKGMSFADKLSQSSKIAKIFEKSPRLMEAFKTGADFLARHKAVTEALRLGTTQGLQTEAKTGGDTGTALKEAATGTVLGYGMGKVGKLAEQGVNMIKGSEGVQKAQQLAADALDKSGVTEGVRKTISAVKRKVSGDYAKDVAEQVKQPLAGALEEVSGSPASQAAKGLVGNPEINIQQPLKEALNAPVSGLDNRVKALTGALAEPETQAINRMSPADALKKAGVDPKKLMADEGENFDNIVEGLLNGEAPMSPTIRIANDKSGEILGHDDMIHALAAKKASAELGRDIVSAREAGESEGVINDLIKRKQALDSIPVNVIQKTKPFTIDNLVTLRQQAGKLEREFNYSDPNAWQLRRIRDGIDDTIEQMAQNAGKPEIADAYAGIRAGYRNDIQLLKSMPIEKLAEKEPGKMLQDVGQFLLTGNKNQMLSKAQTVRQVIGDKRMDKVGESIFKNFIKDSTLEDGKLDIEKFIRKWDTIDDSVKQAIFGNKPLTEFEKLGDQIKMADKAIKFNKSAITAAAYKAHVFPILLANMFFGKKTAVNMLDAMASNPNLMKTVGNTFRIVGGTAKALQRPAAHFGANVFNTEGPIEQAGNAAKATAGGVKSAYQGAKDVLGGE